MSKIPDCRTDENYNEKYLNEENGFYVNGYDDCVAYGIDNFFNNINIYEDEIKEVLKDLPAKELEIDEDALFEDNECPENATILTKLLKVIKESLLDYAEMSRDEIITGLIENQKDTDIVKEKVDSEGYKNPVMRKYEFIERYERGELPTCFTYERDKKTGKLLKIGHCPNGKTVISPAD